jgi:hypothetical protein
MVPKSWPSRLNTFIDNNPFKYNFLLNSLLMLEKLNQLSFVIGVFFIIVSIILLVGYIVSDAIHFPINLYSGVGMMIFGIVMVNFKD